MQKGFYFIVQDNSISHGHCSAISYPLLFLSLVDLQIRCPMHMHCGLPLLVTRFGLPCPDYYINSHSGILSTVKHCETYINRLALE